jgi:hypothetical protein
LLKALPAQHRAALGRLERNRGLDTALGADSSCLHSAGRSSAPLSAGLPFVLAGLTTLGLVPEFLFVVELLLTRGEDKISAAIDALQIPVLKFHGTILVLVFQGGPQKPKAKRLPFASPFRYGFYSGSRRVFFRFRLRARAAFTRFFSPGFR